MVENITEYFKRNTPRLPTDISQSTIDAVQVELRKLCSHDKASLMAPDLKNKGSGESLYIKCSPTGM